MSGEASQAPRENRHARSCWQSFTWLVAPGGFCEDAVLGIEVEDACVDGVTMRMRSLSLE